MKRFFVAFVAVMLVATVPSLGDQSGAHFNLVISNSSGAAINLTDNFRDYYPKSCSPVTSEFGETLAASAQEQFSCQIGAKFQQGDPVFDVMDGGRNTIICHIYWDDEHWVFALGVTGECSVSRDGDTATVTVH